MSNAFHCNCPALGPHTLECKQSAADWFGLLRPRRVEKPILGPVRCLCAEPDPSRIVDGGIWGTVACAKCCCLMIRQP